MALNRTQIEIEQAIEFHLALDKKMGNTDRSSWHPFLLELYKKKKMEEHKQKKGSE